MPTTLLISPHLDDAVFSCGATIALLVERGWRVVVATAFTRSHHPASGFALDCQRDKGLADDVDYMALRRAEDLAALAALGAEARHLDLPEAPMRGYDDAQALFGDFVERDDIAVALSQAIAAVMTESGANLLMGPSALGGHVDHRRVLDAVLDAMGDLATAFWRDVPYAIRHEEAQPDSRVTGLEACAVTVGDVLPRKIAAAAMYASQVVFQFGSVEAVGPALDALARRDGNGVAVERFYATPAGLRALQP